MPSIRRPATRWPSRGWPAPGSRRTRSGGSTCSGRSGADTWVDVSATIERKIDALRAHASQIHDLDGLAERIRTWAAEEGAPIGAAAAEGLRLVVIDDDEDEGPG